MRPGYEKVLTAEAIDFAAELQREFGAERRRLLARRGEIQRRLDAGWKPDFLPETQTIRDGDWRVAPIPGDLQDRRVEITGPTDRKMVINALNSGANVFMADFEDANTPSWQNLIEGQINLIDAVRRTISFDEPQTGRHYALNEKTAVLFVRPRGWHLPEAHVLVDDEPMSGALFDFALFFFHNAKELGARGTGPYLYLPKLESHLEARLWNNVFLHPARPESSPTISCASISSLSTSSVICRLTAVPGQRRADAVSPDQPAFTSAPRSSCRPTSPLPNGPASSATPR
jgi:malate synthase